MKQASELTGLAVVVAGSGERTGRIQDVRFEPGSGRITAFQVPGTGFLAHPYFLPRLWVRSLGDDALMIDAPAATASAEPHQGESGDGSLSAHDLHGRPVLNDAGKVIGHIADVLLDPATLTVTGFAVSTGIIDSMLHAKPTLPLSVVQTIGADSVIIPAEFDFAKTKNAASG